MNDQQTYSATDQAAAFQKIWLESITKTMQAAFTMKPNELPPEVLRQIRSGIFQALAESWEEFMRSPQFLEGMKQWMEASISFRNLSNEFMGKMRHEFQAPSREDIDSIILAVRHVEKRVLDRLEEISVQVNALAKKGAGPKPARRARPSAKTK